MSLRVVAGLVVVAAAACSSGASSSRPRANVPEPPTVRAPALATTPGWQDLGAVPGRTGRYEWADATVVWTGHELLVWGGTRISDGDKTVDGGSDRPHYLLLHGVYDHVPIDAVASGARFDAQAHEWHAIAPPPSAIPLLGAGAVWDGHELIVVGQRCWTPSDQDLCFPGGFGAAAYDPARNRWTTLPDPPAQHASDAATNRDERFVTGAAGWTGRYAVFQLLDDLTYEPATKQWRRFRTAIADAELCAAPGHVVAYGAGAVVDVHGSTTTTPPTLPPQPISGSAVETTDDRFAVATDRDLGSWRVGPPFANDGDDIALSLTCSARAAAVFRRSDGSAVVFDLASQRLTPHVAQHGAWYQATGRFAPLTPDAGHDVVLPDHTVAVVSAGRRVYAIADAGEPGRTSAWRLHVLLRH